MFEAGSRSKQVATFMLPADVAAFSDAVAQPIAGLATWETHHRTAGIVPHDSLRAAMKHNHVQAFLRLRGRDGATVGHLRLAFKWFPDNEADCVRRDFPALVDLAWKALRKVTSPHVTTVDGKPVRRYRVGPAAKAWALQHPERLVRDGALLLKVKDTR